MITVNEIRKKSQRKYLDVVKCELKEEKCFPLSIRSNKSLPKDFVQMSREIAEILGNSKDRKGFGYSVISVMKKTRQHGIQDVPIGIVFETLADYLKFVNKEKEFQRMMENYHFIKSHLPQLESWLQTKPKIIINNAILWPQLLNVCHWFMNSFEPHKYYIRELPITVHTKFIEENKGVVRLLLEELVPNIVNHTESDFEKRFCLKYDQHLVRFRSLDQSCCQLMEYDDVTVPIDQFKATELKCSRLFIIENKMNFLTFPSLPHAFAIWGKGFAIKSLKNIEWLESKEIYYWSDLDVQGFQMLSQLRSYYPQVKSLLMNKEIIEKYREFILPGTLSNIEFLPHLSVSEMNAFKYLKDNNLRLEQERIDQCDVLNNISDFYIKK